MQIDKHHNISKRVGSSVSSPRHLFPALLCWPLRVTCPVLPLPSGLQLGSAPRKRWQGVTGRRRVHSCQVFILSAPSLLACGWIPPLRPQLPLGAEGGDPSWLWSTQRSRNSLLLTTKLKHSSCEFDVLYSRESGPWARGNAMPPKQWRTLLKGI